MNDTTMIADTISGPDNSRIIDIDEIVSPIELINRHPLDEETSEFIETSRIIISNIVNLEDDRLMVITGPCSIHNPEEALQIAEELKTLQENNRHLYIVMRTYFEKPRTTIGWKGLMNDPDLDDSHNINKGLEVARKLLLDINKIWIPTAVEFLDTMTPQYIADLIHWGAIWARTTESQEHRKLVSGLSMPVWFKNGTNGDAQIAIDAIGAAAGEHVFLGNTKEGKTARIKTAWNPDTHVILRGWSNWPNYEASKVQPILEKLETKWIESGIVIDFSHANSGKNHKNQPDVSSSVAKQIQDWNQKIVWVMIETNINEWNQKHTPGKDDPKNIQPWISITDACVSLETNTTMLSELNKATWIRNNV